MKQTCQQLTDPGEMTPMTVQLLDSAQYSGQSRPAYLLQQRFVAILQADGPAFMRSYVTSQKDSPNSLEVSSRGEAHISPKEGMIGVVYNEQLGGAVTPTAWHVISIGNSAGELLENNYIVPLLCPPPAQNLPNLVDSRWVPTGKSLRARTFSNDHASLMADWVSSTNYQMIHFDAGWYGDENNATEIATRVYPDFAASLDMKTVGEYTKSKGISWCVYVNELALRDTNKLIQIYPSWGVDGIKFGFVNTLSPRAMRVLHERIVAYASVNMFVNVHDIFRPKGLTRTYPHLVTQEGIRGEERKPDALHHTILPFVRLLQGSADYTPDT